MPISRLLANSPRDPRTFAPSTLPVPSNQVYRIVLQEMQFDGCPLTTPRDTFDFLIWLQTACETEVGDNNFVRVDA